MNKPEHLRGKAAEEWQEVLWEELLDSILKMGSKQNAKNLLESLLCSQEKKMLLRRLAVLVLVSQGKSYKEIGEILWISSSTVSAIKKVAFRKTGHYQSARFGQGKRRYSSLAINAEKKNINLLDAVAALAIVFKPFLQKGIGVMGDRD
ncbi:MAG: Trp family transcriptional regulator [bacterium]|nr:Trp family transcriptional regulator [bacterium]